MRVKWFQVIDELERSGVTMRSQAAHIGVALGTIYYWKSGGEPKYNTGQLLLDLYMRQVGKEPPIERSTGHGATFSNPIPSYRFQSTLTST